MSVCPAFACLLFSVLAHDLATNRSIVWREDLDAGGFHHWTTDAGDDWRSAVSLVPDSDGGNGGNVLILHPAILRPYALYFQKTLETRPQGVDCDLTVELTVQGCEAHVQLIWQGRLVLEGPKSCSNNVWLPLKFPTVLTSFDALEMMLILTPSKLEHPVLLSRLEVELACKDEPTTKPRDPKVARDESNVKYRGALGYADESIFSNAYSFVVSYLSGVTGFVCVISLLICK